MSNHINFYSSIIVLVLDWTLKTTWSQETYIGQNDEKQLCWWSQEMMEKELFFSSWKKEEKTRQKSIILDKEMMKKGGLGGLLVTRKPICWCLAYI